MVFKLFFKKMFQSTVFFVLCLMKNKLENQDDDDVFVVVRA